MRIGKPQAGQSRQAGRSTRSRSGGWRPEVLVIPHLPSGTEDPHPRMLPDNRLCHPSFLTLHFDRALAAIQGPSETSFLAGKPSGNFTSRIKRDVVATESPRI